MIVVHGYFDNSGKPEDPNALVVNLGGFVATLNSWNGFSEQWQQAIGKYGLSYFHAREFFDKSQRRNEHYQISDEEGEQLLDDLRILAESHFHAKDSFGVCCSVPKNEYDKAKSVLGDRLPAIAEVCGDHCCWELYEYSRVHDQRFVLYYDQGEAQFFRKIKKMYDSRRLRKQIPMLRAMITSPSPLDSRKTPALQAADMLVWLVNRTLTRLDQPYAAAWGFPGISNTFMDSQEMIERYE